VVGEHLVDNPRLASGSNVELTIPRDRIYLFDAETGAAVSRW
jgi:hypothetical protein